MEREVCLCDSVPSVRSGVHAPSTSEIFRVSLAGGGIDRDRKMAEQDVERSRFRSGSFPASSN